jgi:DNA-binding beta-propeller fold protein YncE
MPASSRTRSPALVRAILLGTLALAGCYGNGGGGGTIVPVSTTGTGSQLYVSGNTSPRLLIYNDANTVSGSTLPNRVVAGGLTTLSGPRGIAVDMARDQIYVANFLNDSILVFHSARTVTGGDAPSRTITGAPLSRPSALFMDVVNNRLYVVNTSGNSILIYDNASTLNGGVAPSRTLTGVATTLSAPIGIYVDTTRNLLYVSNGNNKILVFSNAASVTGNVVPARTIAGLSSPGGIYVDVMTDRLYVADTGANAIVVFNNASTANGSPTPDRMLSGGGTQLNQPRDVFVDTGTDRLYVANFGSNSILVFDNASTVTNPAVPSRNLSLTASTGPWGIYVDVTPIVIGSTANLDGYARSDGTASASGSPATGDKDASYSLGVGWRQLYSFEISNIPTSTTITSATLRLYQCDVQGSPYTFLGNVIVDQMNYGGVFDPFGSAYSGGAVALNIGTLSTTTSPGYRSLSVTTRLQNDLTTSRVRSQYRLRFSTQDFNFDGNDDFVQFTDAEDSPCAGATTNQPPQLVVTLKP